MSQRVSVADLDLTSVNIAQGSNDRVATVSVTTSASFSGYLQLKVDADTLILDGPALVPTPVEEFESIYNATLAQQSFQIVAIPEPNALNLIVFSILIGVMPRSSRSRNLAGPGN